MMLRSILPFALVIICLTFGCQEGPSPLPEGSFNSDAFIDSEGLDIVEVKGLCEMGQDELVVVGLNESEQSIIAVLNGSYQPVWQQRIDESHYEVADVIEVDNGSFIVVVNSLSFNFRSYMTRLDNNGNELWKSTLGTFTGDYTYIDQGQINNSQIILGGLVGQHWTNGTDAFYGVYELSDGSIIDEEVVKVDGPGRISGTVVLEDSTMLHLLNHVQVGFGLDSMSLLLADSTIGLNWVNDSGFSFGLGKEMALGQGTRGTIYVSYTRNSNDFGSAIVLTALNIELEPVWEVEFTGSDRERALDLLTLPNGKIILAGSTSSYGNGSTDALLLCFGQNGDELWARTFGSEHSEAATHVVEHDDGTFTVAVNTSKYENGDESLGATFLRLDSNGNPID